MESLLTISAHEMCSFRMTRFLFGSSMGECFAFLGKKCSSRHNFASLDSIFEVPIPVILLSLESGWWRPTYCTQSLYPERLTVANSLLSTYWIHPGLQILIVYTPGIHGTKIISDRALCHFVIYQPHKVVVVLTLYVLMY